jgi:CDGSH-type Zn-finger protein
MQNQSLPKIAVSKSIKIDVEAGKSYYWCACGLSQSQPFCDGSHIGTEFTPVLYQANESKTVGFCGCKQSKSSPICDGAHKTIMI